MVQRLDSRSFFLHPELSVPAFLALVLKVCWDRFRCHGQSVAEPATSKLSTLALFQWSAMVSRALLKVSDLPATGLNSLAE